MKILVINAGSSSLKYQLMDPTSGEVFAKGLCERIYIDGKLTHKVPATGLKVERDIPMPTHSEAIEAVLSILVDPEYGVLKSTDEIDAIGHRVLHGGDKFVESCIIDEACKQAIRDCIPLGPLHNPANLMGIEACEKVMPGKPQVAVFDTAFHMTMPPKAYRYAIPTKYYEEDHLRRYGFHGTSHRYVSKRAIELMGKPANELKIVVCHLGNGSSISAVKGGKCIDTSMGLTPLEGVPMGTRCGDMDPAIVIYLMKKLGLDAKGMDNYMNKKSGMLGISGVSSDFRDLGAAAAEGNERAELALAFKAMLECRTKLEVIMQDERLTTVAADEILQECGMPREKRKTVIDQVAAGLILQDFMENTKKGSKLADSESDTEEKNNNKINSKEKKLESKIKSIIVDDDEDDD